MSNLDLTPEKLINLTAQFKKFYEKEVPEGHIFKNSFNGDHPLYNKIEIPFKITSGETPFPVGFKEEDIPVIKVKLSIYELYWLMCVNVVKYEECPPLSVIESFICTNESISDQDIVALRGFLSELRSEVEVSYKLLAEAAGTYKNSTYPTLNHYRKLNAQEIERESNILFSRIKSLNEPALSERFYMVLVDYLIGYAAEANEPHIVFLDYAVSALEAMLKNKESFEHSEFMDCLKKFNSEDNERAITEAALTMYMDSNRFSVEINEVLTVFELIALRLVAVLALEKFTEFKESCQLSS